jgi:hypothetical protein
MARRGMMTIALLALLVVAGGVVMMTEGARLLLAARVLLWYGPDNAARAWETYMRPHGLRDAVTGHTQWPPRRRDRTHPRCTLAALERQAGRCQRAPVEA